MPPIYERRIGKRGQIEAILPIGSLDAGSGAQFRHWRHRARIEVRAESDDIKPPGLSAGIDVVMPTGREQDGLGGGQWVFEPYLSTATTIGSRSYLQAQQFELPKFPPTDGHPPGTTR